MFKSLYTKWVARLTPNCRTITRVASESLDRKLTLRERLFLKMHFSVCVWCERFQKQIKFLKRTLGQSTDLIRELDSETLSPERKAAMKDSIQKKIKPQP